MKTFAIDCDGEEFSPTNVNALEEALRGFVETDVTLAVEVCFVSAEEIRRLNRETRSVDKVTDVLSYPALELERGQKIEKKEYPYEVDEEGRLLLGSIAVCMERASEQAIEYGHSLNRELHYLLVHGIMHCLGYDHETDADRTQMREKEEAVLEKMGITRE